MLPMLVSFVLFIPFKKMKITIWYGFVMMAILFIGLSITILSSLGAANVTFDILRWQVGVVFGLLMLVGICCFLCCALVGVIHQGTHPYVSNRFIALRIKRIRSWYERNLRHKKAISQMYPMQNKGPQDKDIQDQDLDTLPEIALEKRQKYIETRG